MDTPKRSGISVPLVDRKCGKCGAAFRAAAQANLCRECGAELTDLVSVVVTVTATPNEGEPFSHTDLLDAVEATLHEVFPVNDGLPVVPTIVRV